MLGGARLTRACPVATLSRMYIVGGTAATGSGSTASAGGAGGTTVDSREEEGADQQEEEGRAGCGRHAADGSESYLDTGVDLDLDHGADLGTGRMDLPESRRLRLAVHDALHDASPGGLSALNAIPMPWMMTDEDGNAGVGGGSVVSTSLPSSSASSANEGRLPQCLRPRQQRFQPHLHANKATSASFGADQRYNGDGDTGEGGTTTKATEDGGSDDSVSMAASGSNSAACPSWRVQRYLTGSGTHQGRMVLELQREGGAVDGAGGQRDADEKNNDGSSSNGGSGEGVGGGSGRGCGSGKEAGGGGGDGGAAGEVCVFQLVPWFVKLWLHTLELRINGQVGKGRSVGWSGGGWLHTLELRINGQLGGRGRGGEKACV